MKFFENNQATAIVTGGSTGIGAAIVEEFAKQGVTVIFCGRDEVRGAEVVETLSRQNLPGKVDFFKADLVNSKEVCDFIAYVIKCYGKINFLINNAGVAGPTQYTVADYPEDAWDMLLNINLKAAWLCMKHSIPYLLKQSSPAIVNIGSYSGSRGSRNAVAYNVSKHGLVGLTKSAAMEYAAQNLRINLISPGIIDTPLSRNIYNSALDQAKYLHPMRRLALPTEIAKAAYWLCSENAEFITGIVLPVDGGMLI